MPPAVPLRATGLPCVPTRAEPHARTQAFHVLPRRRALELATWASAAQARFALDASLDAVFVADMLLRAQTCYFDLRGDLVWDRAAPG